MTLNNLKAVLAAAETDDTAIFNRIFNLYVLRKITPHNNSHPFT